MPGIEDETTVWRKRVKSPALFDRFRVKELGKGASGALETVVPKEQENYVSSVEYSQFNSNFLRFEFCFFLL